MPFDFKKEYKELYQPKSKPQITAVPPMNYIAVRGTGDPNEDGGAYQQAISVLYAVAYTLKMSYKTDYKIAGFFEYIVPPLEGFWRQDDVDGVNYADKSGFHWISVIRLPDFVTKTDFDWAVQTAAKKKHLDCSSAEFLTIEEGLCVQMMHVGSYDDEPASGHACRESWGKYMQTTSPPSGCTTRFISPIRAKPRRRNAKPSFATRSKRREITRILFRKV